jgi:hypothetical protein
MVVLRICREVGCVMGLRLLWGIPGLQETPLMRTLHEIKDITFEVTQDELRTWIAEKSGVKVQDVGQLDVIQERGNLIIRGQWIATKNE